MVTVSKPHSRCRNYFRGLYIKTIKELREIESGRKAALSSYFLQAIFFRIFIEIKFSLLFKIYFIYIVKKNSDTWSEET